MMINFFLFSSFAHLYLVKSSSIMSQCGDGNEQKQYDDFGLVSAFHKCLIIPTWESQESFRSYVRGYYNQSPIDCLNLLDRYRSNWIFKVVFWKSIAGTDYFIDPLKIIPFAEYSNVLYWMSCKIRAIFLDCSYSDESKFKTELETISLMVKSGERTAFELKSLKINEELISRFSDLIAIWKYLIRNISIDFTDKTIDYYSLLRTFNEASILVKTDSSSIGPSLRLSKRYALLWFYLQYIYKHNCKFIFDIHRHHNVFIIYFIVELRSMPLSCRSDELYPDMLRFLFEKLYKNGSPQLDPILELIRGEWWCLELYRNWLGITREASNYSELVRFFTESSEKEDPITTWHVRALAELEAYLIQCGQKLDYLTK